MSDYSNLKTLLVERKGSVLTITLNRPEVLNAVNKEMDDELRECFHMVSQDREADAVVVTGAGRAFCAGGDIKAIQAGNWDGEMSGTVRLQNSVRSGFDMIKAMLEIEQPIIAAVNGDAVGLGATLALFCDIAIASDTARIGDTHIRVGAVAGDGGAVVWPLLMSLSRAKEFLMTGDLISAAEAERIGLFNHVVPVEEVQSAAFALAERLANGPTVAIRWTKMALNQRLIDEVNRVLPLSIALEALSFTTKDYAEAINAFTEKRPPQFKGQ
ncbi:MAG: enoyl-CoA hydratase-related protein [Chloroflexi bacterium]|nr:enoyl-CoA hydratase-related protein [Chloroflexota bacterium]